MSYCPGTVVDIVRDKPWFVGTTANRYSEPPVWGGFGLDNPAGISLRQRMARAGFSGPRTARYSSGKAASPRSKPAVKMLVLLVGATTAMTPSGGPRELANSAHLEVRPAHGQRSPRLNVIASNGRMLTGSSSFTLAISIHIPFVELEGLQRSVGRVD